MSEQQKWRDFKADKHVKKTASRPNHVSTNIKTSLKERINSRKQKQLKHNWKSIDSCNKIMTDLVCAHIFLFLLIFINFY